MSNCIKCGKYFSITRQTDYCPECENSNISACDMPLPQGFGEQKGWICPVCGRGVAPWVNYCPCQGDWKITYGTSTGINGFADVDECKKWVKEHQDKITEELK